nr:MAG TPA_asm: hypothetical protein [Caudoviricetes sp.]
MQKRKNKTPCNECRRYTRGHCPKDYFISFTRECDMFIEDTK